MKWGAHVLVALGATTIALGEVSRLALPLASSFALCLFFVGSIVSAAAGAVLPDMIDCTLSRAGVRHRNSATHGFPSLTIPLFMIMLAYCLFLVYLPACLCIAGGMALGFPIGWVLHLLLDALTPLGIPLPAGQFTWDWARYDSPAANHVLKVVGSACVLAGILTLVDPVYPLFLPLLAALWASRWRSDRITESDICVKVLTVENVEVVATLTGIATIFDRKKDQGRAIAYRNAANSIRRLRWSLKENYTRVPLEDIPFIGRNIAGVIKDLLKHGHSHYLQWLHKMEREGKIGVKNVPRGPARGMNVRGKPRYPFSVNGNVIEKSPAVVF